MENKRKIKFNNVDFLLQQNGQNPNRNLILKKMTPIEKVRKISYNFIKKVINFLSKPFLVIINSIKKKIADKKAKKFAELEQKKLNAFFEKNYGASVSHVKSIIDKMENKSINSEDNDFETIRLKNVKEINKIKRKLPLFVDPDSIVEHNETDNSGKPTLIQLIKEEEDVANKILKTTPLDKKIKKRANFLLKTSI